MTMSAGDVLWALFATALVVTAIVCFTKLIYITMQSHERAKAAQVAAWQAQARAAEQQRQAREIRYGRGGY